MIFFNRLLVILFALIKLNCLPAQEQSRKANSDDFHLVEPLELLSPQRMDLIAKYIYIKHKDWKVEATWSRNLYERHLQICHNFLTGPIHIAKEASFQQLLDSIKLQGYNPNLSPIWLDLHGVLSDGAHRVACCLLFGQKLFARVDHIHTSPQFDMAFFKAKKMEEHYLDAMAIEFCELRKDCYVFVVFPAAIGQEKKVEEILNRFGKIVYKKEVFLNSNGALNLVLEMYDGESWLNQFSWVVKKASCCFPSQYLKTNPSKVFLVTCNDYQKAKFAKTAIRNLYGIGHDSIHCTDNHVQSIRLAKAVFNANSIHFLNHRIIKKQKNLEHFLQKYRTAMQKKKQLEHWYCIDGSAILAAYGLRDCRDLDYIHHGNQVLTTDIYEINAHNNEKKYHAYSLDEIIFNPIHYFYYKGIKFASLDVIYKMKKRRAEKKDFSDLLLIEKALK